jgi:hypothetical protein
MDLKEDLHPKKEVLQQPKKYDTDFGFIITRHVNSEKTNKYWNINVKLLNRFYPNKLIVIIDDNSNKNFLKPIFQLKNVLIIQSNYPKRGELLPYIYFIYNKWFEKAVIIHDGVFFHRRIPFEKIKSPAIPLWHFNNYFTRINLPNILKTANYLKYSKFIKYHLSNNTIYNGCFGVQSVIKHKFLVYLNNKYKLQNLIHGINSREERCSLERIMGLLFFLETKIRTSVLGSIFKQRFEANYYTFDNYINDVKRKRIPSYVIKVFTGR